jgi:hypothetical protein
MNESFSFLIGPATSLVASLVFFWLVRREGRKTAALVHQLEEKFHSLVEEQIRRIQQGPESSRKALPEGIQGQAPGLSAHAPFRAADKQESEAR